MNHHVVVLLAGVCVVQSVAAGDWNLYRHDPRTDSPDAQALVATVRGDRARQECLRLARVLEDAGADSECARAVLLASGASRITYWCEPVPTGPNP